MQKPKRKLNYKLSIDDLEIKDLINIFIQLQKQVLKHYFINVKQRFQNILNHNFMNFLFYK